MFDNNNIDSFVTLSRDNTSIECVDLHPFDSDAGNYEFWDKVGQIVGNLMGFTVRVSILMKNYGLESLHVRMMEQSRLF
jgi:hypothetical protein